jgi:hypothetical protein
MNDHGAQVTPDVTWCPITHVRIHIVYFLYRSARDSI